MVHRQGKIGLATVLMACGLALSALPAAAQITGSCCGKTVVLNKKGTGLDRCFDCKKFMESGATSWPPAEACTMAGRLRYAMNCGVIPDCPQREEQDLRESICTQLREQGALAPGSTSGVSIPGCVRDALKEVLPDYLKVPEMSFEVNLDKVKVFKGTKPSTETEIYLDGPGVELALQSPCALPFALYVGTQIQRLRLRREMEQANRKQPGTFTEEQIKNGIPAVLDGEKEELMRDLKAYYDQHGLNGELDCCKPLELPTPEPGREPVSCPEIEPYCKPRIAGLVCPTR